MKYSETYIRYNLYNLVHSKYFSTQKELALCTGLSESAISLYINGKINPSIDALMALSKVSGSIDWFLTDVKNSKTIDKNKCVLNEKMSMDNFYNNIKILYMESDVFAKSIFLKSIDADLSYSAMYNWFSKKSKPTIASICILSNALHIKPSDLFHKDTILSMLYTKSNHHVISEEYIGHNVKNILIYKDISAYDLSKKIGMDINTISDCINEKHNISLENILLICKELNVSIKYLVSNPRITIYDMFTNSAALDQSQSETYSNFVSNMKRICKYSGINITTISKMCNVNRVTVYTWLRSSHLPTAHNICSISKNMHIPVDKLFQEVKNEKRN